MAESHRLSPRKRSSHPSAYWPDYKSSIKRSPRNALLSLESTVTEETGPVFGHDTLGEYDNDLIQNFTQGKSSAVGERIRVHGRVTDEDGRAVTNTLVEIWQANAGGRYRHANDSYFAPLDPNFGGCGRTITDANGVYEFMTVKPGAYPWPNGGNDWRPAHIHFSLFGASFGQRLISQMYFEGDPLIPLCPIAASVANHSQLDRLVAPLDMAGAQPMDYLAYRFDIVLRGRRQTMFENRTEGL